ncbi:MAG: 30S ribosomal protein S11, partial [Francisellaceae bacterium]|nr:30S ribosomal protein S11 [Francisellaceae bacterium]
MAKASTSRQRKKVKRIVTSGRVYIQATFNNTLVYLTDLDGNTLAWSTAGGQGFKGSRKSTPFAAQQASKAAAQAASDSYGLRSVEVYVKGPGPGRDSAIKAVA